MKLKKWLRSIMPDPRQILENPYLGVFGTRLKDPNLWYLNRKSAAGAFGVGLFVMYLPPFGQMLVAAAAAIWLRVNLPISVALVWISNPLTIPPMFYFAYLLGCWILGLPSSGFDLDFWLTWNHWLDWHNWVSMLAPLLLGSLVCATVCGTLGYFSVQWLWRSHLRRQIRERRARYAAAASSTRTPSSSTHT